MCGRSLIQNLNDWEPFEAGYLYIVIGQYYRWYEFQYDQSPSGTGWVFDELVNVTGNTERIPDLTLGTSTPDLNADQTNSTLVVLTQTPGSSS